MRSNTAPRHVRFNLDPAKTFPTVTGNTGDDRDRVAIPSSAAALKKNLSFPLDHRDSPPGVSTRHKSLPSSFAAGTRNETSASAKLPVELNKKLLRNLPQKKRLDTFNEILSKTSDAIGLASLVGTIKGLPDEAQRPAWHAILNKTHDVTVFAALLAATDDLFV